MPLTVVVTRIVNGPTTVITRGIAGPPGEDGTALDDGTVAGQPLAWTGTEWSRYESLLFVNSGDIQLANSKGLIGPIGEGVIAKGSGSTGVIVGNNRTFHHTSIKFFTRGDDEDEQWRMDTSGNLVGDLGDVNLTLGNYVLSANGAELQGPGSRSMVRIDIGGAGVQVGHRSGGFTAIPLNFYAGSSTTRFTIATDGAVTVAALAGTGTRNVVADATGKLSAAAPGDGLPTFFFAPAASSPSPPTYNSAGAATLAAAVNALGGAARVVCLSDGLSSSDEFVIPAAFVIEGNNLFELIGPRDIAYVVFQDGAQIRHPARLYNLNEVYCEAYTVSPIELTDNYSSLDIVNTRLDYYDGASDEPIIDIAVPSGAFRSVTITFREGSYFDNGFGDPAAYPIDVAANNGLRLVILDAYIAFAFDDLIKGGSGSSLGIFVDATGPATLPSLPGWSGSAPVLNQIDDAKAVKYTPSVSGDWSTVPSRVAPALDTLAAEKLRVLSTTFSLATLQAAGAVGTAVFTIGTLPANARVIFGEVLVNQAVAAPSLSAFSAQIQDTTDTAATVNGTIMGTIGLFGIAAGSARGANPSSARQRFSRGGETITMRSVMTGAQFNTLTAGNLTARVLYAVIP